ncbi:MAG: hypothetical protein JRH08_12170 [Deltaproteobacteria bacterium]|nr:hypothetical protein [Deltaproteobacteria bacterium]MBW2026483.1 hypothetical protein [Deltaproteobacteria bacterium]MBW2126426.1 hypothetical protein [Deltaproteobacteria bacterium]
MRNANIIISMPFLPPSFNAYRRYHWRVQRKTEAIWKNYIFAKWLELKKPTYEAVHITLHFYFPDKRLRDMDNYMATGSKLVGDALKGCFIPDDSPEHLKGWGFLFGLDRQNPRTIIELKEINEINGINETNEINQTKEVTKNGQSQRDHIRGGALEDPGRIQGYAR